MGTSFGNFRTNYANYEKMRPAQSAPNGVTRLRCKGSAAASKSYQSNLDVIHEFGSSDQRTLKNFKSESLDNFTNPDKVNFY
jgi:hypothetical protein